MRLHIISLPHTQTTREFSWCAYTDKVRKFCDMMTSLNYEVYLYASEENEANCTELITCVTKKEQRDWWPGWDYKKSYWPDGWDSAMPWWQAMNGRAIMEIAKRIEPHDVVGIIGGACQKTISDAFPNNRSVEWGIGYKGVFALFQIFESYAWMHHVYGRQQWENGRNYDAVIPNSFDPDDFPTYRDGNDGYLLYLGRLVESKGTPAIKEIVRATGLPLKVAGQGELSVFDGIKVDYQGIADVKTRVDLMSNALAVLVPTNYVEPFGGVAVEAQLCGTPAITTDWGAFTETVNEGVTGFRCRTLKEFVDAVEASPLLDGKEIRSHAERYLTTNVRYEYDRYFKRLDRLNGPGWYDLS